MKRALIFGVGGQDGSYLTESLIADGYEVHGCVHEWGKFGYVGDLLKNNGNHLHLANVTSESEVNAVVRRVKPDEVYNLAAHSHVGESFHYAAAAIETIALGTTRVLEAVRNYAPTARVYLAGSLDMFGNVPGPQSETTIAQPISPYGAARVAAFNMGRIYREVYGMHVSTGITASHESPRRDPKFLTRKVTMAVACYEKMKREKHERVGGSLHLGSLDSMRDWTHARDAVRAMRLMTAAESADDYVIGSGVSRLVHEFVAAAFKVVGLNWINYVKTNFAFNRPADISCMEADSTKIREAFGWEPLISFESMVAEMVRNDINLLAGK